MQYRKALMLTACLFFCALLSAQHYPFVQYTPKDGLVNSRVRKVYQDGRGRIYFLTYGGLSVYDGARFINYTVQNGLATDMVNDILELGDDSLLVSTNTSQLNILVHGKMKLFTTTDKNYPVINQFLKSRDGNIYATADQGLFVLKQQRLEPLPFPLDHPEMGSPYLGTVIEWGDFLVCATNDLRNYIGLYIYDKKKRKLTDAEPDKIISCLGKDNNNHIWVALDNGIYNLDTTFLQSGKIKFIPAGSPYKKLAGYTSSSFSFDDHNVWLVNKGKEIIKAGDNGSLTTISVPEQQWPLSKDPVFIDRENITWICTEGNGVIKLISTGFRTEKTTFGKDTRDIIHSVSYISDTTWYFINNNLLVRKTGNDYKKFTGNISTGFFCIGQYNGNLIAGDGKSIYSAKIPAAGHSKFFFNRELTIPDTNSMGAKAIIDPPGNIITCSDQILVLHHNKVIYHQPVQAGDIIEGIKTDAANRLWIVTRYSGISVFTVHPEDPVNYLQKFLSFSDELKDISPRCMLLDKKDVVWIGTRYNGVISFMLTGNKLKKIQQFQTGQGLTDNFVTALACDSSGNIIVGTQTGLDRLVLSTPNEYRIENITKSNNIFGFIKTIWVNSRNETYALTNTGTLFQLLPVEPTVKKYEPQLFIEEIKVNGEPVQPGASYLRLPYNRQNLNFSLAAPTYIDEKQVLYSYRLTGNNNSAWNEAAANASINLLNLPAGEYTLVVKAFFRSTAYSSKELSYHFIITPPWWQSWWFRLLAALLAVILLILAIRIYYRRKLEKQTAVMEKQQAIERERTRIASDMHDDLGAGLSTIRFLSEKVKRNSFSDVTKNDAEKIVVNSNELVQKMNEIIWAMNEKNDTLEDLLFYTRSYAVEYCEENNLSCETYLPETVPPVFVSGEIRRNVFLTVKESLHNIVKHANAKKVIIDFKINAALLVTIKDDGKGLSEDGKGSGNGLRNMQKRIESVNGIFEIVNTDGVIVKMKVPLQL